MATRPIPVNILTWVISGPYAMTKLYIRIHTFTTRHDSLTRMGGLTPRSKPQRPGFLDPVAGTNIIIKLITFQTLFNRICPGRHFALRMLHFTLARILATFDILPPVGDDGRPKIPEAKYGKSILRSVHNSGCGTGLIQSPAIEIRCHLNAS